MTQDLSYPLTKVNTQQMNIRTWCESVRMDMRCIWSSIESYGTSISMDSFEFGISQPEDVIYVYVFESCHGEWEEQVGYDSCVNYILIVHVYMNTYNNFIWLEVWIETILHLLVLPIYPSENAFGIPGVESRNRTKASHSSMCAWQGGYVVVCVVSLDIFQLS